MDAPSNKYTVLGNGEKYMSPFERARRPARPPTPKRKLEEARNLLMPQVTSVVATARALPATKRLDEVVVELRLDEKYLAKSYHPDDLLRATGLHLRGAGSWCQTVPEKPPRGKRAESPTDIGTVEVSSRSVFVSGNEAALTSLQRAIATGISDKTDADVIKIESIRLPEPSDRLRQGIGKAHQPEPVELVLYAWDDQRREDAITRIHGLLVQYGSKKDQIHVRRYSGGPVFIAAISSPSAIAELGDLNYLRVARPLPRMELTRDALGPAKPAPAPPPPVTPKSWVAVFDGGFASPHPHLDPFIKVTDLTCLRQVFE